MVRKPLQEGGTISVAWALFSFYVINFCGAAVYWLVKAKYRKQEVGRLNTTRDLINYFFFVQ